MSKTLNYYNKIAADFIADTVSIEFNHMHELLLKHMPEHGRILDLGCGSGRDSLAFKKAGYIVTATDGSVEMCRAASDLIGDEVLHQRFEGLDCEDVFDGIWASASLLHVPYKDLPMIFSKLKRALKAEGYVYMSFKYGEFEGVRKGRYFTDLNEERLGCAVAQVDGLEVIEYKITTDVRPGREHEKWLNVIVTNIN